MDATEHLMIEKYMFYSDTFHMNRNDNPQENAPDTLPLLYHQLCLMCCSHIAY